MDHNLIVELTKSNVFNFFTIDDVAAFEFAFGGASGEGGGVYIITKDGKAYHLNYMYGDVSIEDVERLLPILKHINWGILGWEMSTPEGWHGYYLGVGNNLIVSDLVFKEVEAYDATYIYREVLHHYWMDVVLNVLSGKEVTPPNPEYYLEIKERYDKREALTKL